MIYAGLIAFFFLEYVRPTSYWPPLLVLHLNSLVPLSAFVASAFTSGQRVFERMVHDPNTRMIAIMLVLIWLSFMTADVQEWAWNSLTVVGGFALMYWVIGAEVTTVRKLKGVIVALILVHLVVAALNPVLFTDPETRHYVSSGAFLGDGNDFALSIDVILPLTLFLLLDSRKVIGKFFWAGALLVLVAGVVVTQSRGGTIGLACMGIYYWFKSRKKVQTALVVFVVVGLILAFAPGNYFNRMRMIGDTSEGSASARLSAWGVAIDMAIDNPLLGVGAGHFGVKIGNEYRPAGFVGSGMNAHSIYFLALGELGFPGFILLIWFIVWNLMANSRLARELRARGSTNVESDLQMLASMSASLIAFASAGAFLSALYYPHLYILAGILTAGRNVIREKWLTAPADEKSAAESAGRGIHVHWALRPPPAKASLGTGTTGRGPLGPVERASLRPPK